MRIWRSKLTGMCLAILILLAGLCADQQRTNEFPICASESKINDHNLSRDMTINSIKACTTEMLGNFEGAGIRQHVNQESKQRREMKQSFCFLSADNYLTVTMPTVAFVYGEICPVNRLSEEQITTYIHESDGKKRI